MNEQKILVVDHIAERREHLVQLLEDKGLLVAQAASCEDALSQLEHNKTRLILSETDLPKKSGLYLLKEVKKICPESEVILLTNNASSFSLLQALRHGAYDFILRPGDSGDVLFSTLDRAIDHIRQREEQGNLLLEFERKNRTLNQTIHRLKTLNDNIMKMASNDNIESIFTIMLDVAMKELQASSGFIALFDRKGEKLGLKISQNLSAQTSKRYSKALPAGLIEIIAQRAKSVLVSSQIPNGLATLRNDTENAELLKNPGLLSVPLRLNNKLAGLILLSGHPAKTPFTEHDLHFLNQLVNHTQLHLEKIGQIRILKKKNDAPLEP